MVDRAQRRRYLGSIRYPADPDRMLTDLVRAQAPPDLLQAVSALEDRMYAETDQVEHALDQGARVPPVDPASG